MAFEAGNIVRVAVKFLLEGQFDMVNVLHFFVALNDLGVKEDATVALRGFLEDTYAELAIGVPADILGNLFEFYDVTADEPMPPLTWVDPTPFTGSAESLPPQDSQMIYFPTAKPRTQSRIFLPPCIEATQAFGVLDSGAQSRLLTFGLALLQDPISLVGGDVELNYVVYSRGDGSHQFPTSVVIPNTIRTQRRRRRGVGS